MRDTDRVSSTNLYKQITYFPFAFKGINLVKIFRHRKPYKHYSHTDTYLLTDLHVCLLPSTENKRN